jgi:hypothetical protein
LKSSAGAHTVEPPLADDKENTFANGKPPNELNQQIFNLFIFVL